MDIKIRQTAEPRISERNLAPQAFGTVFCDHVLAADCRDGRWTGVRIEPYGPLALPPSINGLQYGLCAFEGHKAFRTVSGDVVLFRPYENLQRLQRSCRRLVLPEVPEELYIEGLRQLIRVDRDWVPGPEEGSLYIRPCVFATDAALRVAPPAGSRFVIVTCAVGQYYPQPLRLLVAGHQVRAFPGGTGDVKPAGNYAPALLADAEARKQGFGGVLWLDAREHRFVEEAGVMNVFFVIGDTVVTPDLSGTILPGVTRDSVIALLKSMSIPVEERRVSIEEIAAAHADGRLQECFGTGTAATISHVSEINHQGRSLVLPPVSHRRIAHAAAARLADIRTGREPDPFGWLIPV